jgi:hypothetical protein
MIKVGSQMFNSKENKDVAMNVWKVFCFVVCILSKKKTKNKQTKKTKNKKNQKTKKKQKITKKINEYNVNFYFSSSLSLDSTNI